MRVRKHNRMKGYDYSRDNLYFVTICVDGMKCCLGDVVDADAELDFEDELDSEAVGTSRDLSVRIAEGNAEKNDDQNLNAKMQSQKIMQLNQYGKIADIQLDWLCNQYQYIAMHAKIVMPNHLHLVLEIDRNLIFEEDVKIKSLSELVGAFKTTSSKLIHKADFLEFKWKRSFHDTIIKSDKRYQNIVNYIRNNPDKWDNDIFNKK